MASIKDVAKLAGVGVGTVSRAINNAGYVSDEARAKIEKAMDELQYKPNQLARNLFHMKSGIVGVIVPDASHPFFAEFVQCVESQLYDRGYKMMLCNTVRDQNNEREYLEMLDRHIVDGIISGCHTLDIHEYENMKKPIVALDRKMGENIPIVAVNHKKGGRLAGECLLKCKCKNVVQFIGNMALEAPFQERHREFERIMTKGDANVYSYELDWNRFDTSYFESVVQKVFDLHPKVDGIFGVDLIAVGCLKEAVLSGRRVPEDVNIVGYDGTYITSLYTPVITTVVQPVEELASKSVELIIDMIDGKTYKNKEVTLDVMLRPGDTTLWKR